MIWYYLLSLFMLSMYISMAICTVVIFAGIGFYIWDKCVSLFSRFKYRRVNVKETT